MNFLALGFPIEGVVPVANSVVGAASSAFRPLLGLSIFAGLLMMFRPLLAGLVRAALVAVSPRLPLAERAERARAKNQMAVNRLARGLQSQHPSLAAELMSISARD